MSETEHEEEEVVVSKPKKKSGKNIIISLIIVILLIAGAVYFSKLPSGVTGSNDKTVVATVNGEEIEQSIIDDRFAQIKDSIEAQGTDATNEAIIAQIQGEILEEIITSTLLKQKAKEAGISSSAEEIDAELQKIKEQIGDEETFKTELEKAGLTEKILKENIEDQLTIQKYLDQSIDTSAIEVTEEEIAKVYNDAAETNTNLPELETVSEQIRAQIQSTKQQELVNAFVDELRADAEIVKN